MPEPTTIARAEDLGEVALKLMGLYLLFLGLASLPGPIIAASQERTSALGVLGFSAYVTAYLALGVCLMKFSRPLAGKLFGRVAAAPIPLPIGAELQAIAFRVMGVYVLAGSLPELVQWLVTIRESTVHTSVRVTVAGVAVQVAFGLVLVSWRGSWFARLWKHLHPMSNRSAGVS